MNYSQYTRTIRDLPEGPAYLLFGGDDYLINLTTDTIYNRISKKSSGYVEKHRFYADTASPANALAPLQGAGLFSTAVVVIIHDVDKYGANESARLASYLNQPDPNSVLICTAKTIDKRKSFYKQLQKTNTAIVEFKPTREEEMAGWIKAIVAQKGKDISPRAIESLILSVGANLGTAAMEAKKLVSYIGKEQSIGPHHVDELVGKSRVDSAFDLSNAIARRDLAGALSIVDTLLNDGESEIGMVALLRWQFLRILKGKDLELQGIPSQQIPPAVGVHYFQQEFLNILRGFDYQSARNAYLTLFDSDVSLRGKMLNKRYIIENLVVTLCSE